MASTVIYHNPKCSTSRKTLELLRDSGIEPEVVQYLKTPPSRDELVSTPLPNTRS
jgi:arsenate reductase (glutaredoxin)